MDQLEARLQQRFLDDYVTAKRQCHYRAQAFLDMILEKGAVATARQLLAADQAQSGLYELYTCGRLDLTLEAVVLEPEYQPLFTPEELAEARRRLDALGYQRPGRDRSARGT
jgi:hypothetical protein